MIHRFEQLTTGVSQIYKNIQRIKKLEMRSLGLKGTHVMCLHFLSRYPEGLTAARLSQLCNEDKAGISRILADLEQKRLIRYRDQESKKKYRAKAMLTETGKNEALKIKKLILRAVKAGGKGLAEKELEIFYRALFTIAENLEQVSLQIKNENI